MLTFTFPNAAILSKAEERERERERKSTYLLISKKKVA